MTWRNTTATIDTVGKRSPGYSEFPCAPGCHRGCGAQGLPSGCGQPTPAGDAFPQLTPRKREVLTLIAAVLGNAAIAGRRRLAAATVGNHITSIFGKRQVPRPAPPARAPGVTGPGRRRSRSGRRGRDRRSAGRRR
ncbi:LuxR C-terminal-related transcriptional regulator [Actinoplanes nipponensis]|uniref:LuxR C-terminal-related transcriptional regulator n=1 Tax=Actinoplanes nipponensis TaxID=135950 RepID=UPI0034DB096A